MHLQLTRGHFNADSSIAHRAVVEAAREKVPSCVRYCRACNVFEFGICTNVVQQGYLVVHTWTVRLIGTTNVLGRLVVPRVGSGYKMPHPATTTTIHSQPQSVPA